MVLDTIIQKIEDELVLSPEGGWIEKGGPGSGNIGHAGVPGHRGGSAPRGAATVGRAATHEWTSSNYQERFKKEVGCALSDSVTLSESIAIAEGLEGLPTPPAYLSIKTTHDEMKYAIDYKKSGGQGMAHDVAGFYDHDTRRVVLSPQNSKKPGRGEGLYTLRHEYGHSLEAEAAGRSILSKPGVGPYKRAVANGRFPTEYSKTDHSEFFAESFTALSIAADRRRVQVFKQEYPESYQSVLAILGDRMPEDWK